FNVFLLTVFAGAALVLAVTGIYGVIAYTVAQRTQEIGIRMALGANAGAIVAMIVRQGAAMGLAGVTLGTVAGLFLTGLMEHLLYDVRPLDVPTFAIAVAALILLSLVASLIPALRAARVDPAETLR
ncbi:MAG: FtsX-like permease family protein, partial [Vicinamibacterales bacterium]